MFYKYVCSKNYISSFPGVPIGTRPREIKSPKLDPRDAIPKIQKNLKNVCLEYHKK